MTSTCPRLTASLSTHGTEAASCYCTLEEWVRRDRTSLERTLDLLERIVERRSLEMSLPRWLDEKKTHRNKVYRRLNKCLFRDITSLTCRSASKGEICANVVTIFSRQAINRIPHHYCHGSVRSRAVPWPMRAMFSARPSFSLNVHSDHCRPSLLTFWMYDATVIQLTTGVFMAVIYGENDRWTIQWCCECPWNGITSCNTNRLI